MYDAAFFDMIRPGCQASAAAVVPVVLNHIQPRTVIDVGCGEGWWAKAFADLGGCEVLGLDGPGAGGALDGRFVAWDLRYSFADVARGELAVSLEVAEHLSAKRADGFVNDLCSIADVVLFSAAIPGQGGVGHCFPGDTVVSGPAARRSFARCYEGPLTELRFASGEFLAATPNHPILAAQGWVAAGLLKEGDYVVRCRDSEGITAMVPGKYQVPALIHDVAAAIGVAGNVMLRSVPVAAEDFHGDGVGSQVAVVRTDSQLRHRGDASLTQPARELTLTSARMGPSLLSRDGAPALRLKAPLHALHPANQRRGDALLSSRTSPRRGDAVHFGSTPHGHPGRRQPVSDQVPGYAELRSKSAGAGAGLIQFDQVSSVRVRSVCQDVYNLSTAPGWYLANGLIVHNCNEQWPGYWVEKFRAHGYAVSGALRWQIWNDDRVENWYSQNLLVASRRPETYPALFDTPLAEPWPVVHPVLYDARRP